MKPSILGHDSHLSKAVQILLASKFVMQSAARHLVGAGEILRFAQDAIALQP
jgi:hypothetical protein